MRRRIIAAAIAFAAVFGVGATVAATAAPAVTASAPSVHFWG